jgi:transcription initiation factor TFIID subunit 9B
MLLASLGVSAYQERVPLQLLDFAYRYTSSTLQDAVHLTVEGYAGSNMPGTAEPGSLGTGAGGARSGAAVAGSGGLVEVNTVTLQALRLSIASRLYYQFQPGLPKEFLIDMASERNRIALPGASRGYDPSAATSIGGGEAGGRAGTTQQAFSNVSMGGMRLPPERFCLTGVGWNLKDEWESEGEEDIDEESMEHRALPSAMATGAGEGEDEDDEGDGRMEDVFGDDTAMGDEDADEDEDKAMTDT